MAMSAAVLIRRAIRDDLSAIVHLLADDPLGAAREADVDPLPPGYQAAFEAIDHDPNQELVVAVADGRVIGVLQITFIPYLTYQGSWRALIEGVRVASDRRSGGIGRQLIEWCIAPRARTRLPDGAAHVRQVPRGCDPLLRAAWLRCVARGIEAAPRQGRFRARVTFPGRQPAQKGRREPVGNRSQLTSASPRGITRRHRVYGDGRAEPFHRERRKGRGRHQATDP